MRTDYTVLRILVLVGCLPLMVRDASVLTVRGNYVNLECYPLVSSSQGDCSSGYGCNPGKFTTYNPPNGTGFYNNAVFTTPCSPETCAQPPAYSAPTPAECKTTPCCFNSGVCSGDQCHGSDPCCGTANCTGGVCCIANGVPCDENSLPQRCYTQCVNGYCCEPVTYYPCSTGKCCPGLACNKVEWQCQYCGQPGQICCDTSAPCAPG
jgi:hypothetical protein